MADIGWVSIANAATFFSTRYGADAWAALSVANQTSLLTTAWNRILYDPQWSIPATPSVDDKAKLAYAQELTAWYMYTHIEDEDRRKGLQAQAVVSAGIVQESYDREKLEKVPYPPEALVILEKYFKLNKPFYVVDIDRREPVGADQDTTDIDDSLNERGVY